MYETRKHWESETSRINFEAGIRLERGFRHLLISFYPPRILKFMNFLGQRGIRSVGFSEIHKTAFELTGIYSKLAEFALMGYHLYVEVLGNIGKKQFLFCNTIIEKGLEKHPNSIVYKIFSAKSAQMNGEIDRSIKEFEQIFITDNEIFHKFSHWALVWSYALKCDWDQCIKHSELLRKQALHTPAIFTYCSAIFRYFKSYETNDEILKAEATQLFKTIPSLRIGYMGKGSTFEKATIVCANKYLENKEFLFLPVIEMLYNGNIYYFIDGKVELVEPHLAIVEKELKAHLKDLVTTNYIDYYLDALFFKGVLLKHMGRLSEAQNCFNAVLNAKDRIQEMKFIIPHTLLELGLIEMLLNNTEESKVFLNRALNEFTGYMTENLVHLKAYSALRELGVNTDNEHQIETNIVNEYSHRMRAENKCENNNNLIEILRL